MCGYISRTVSIKAGISLSQSNVSPNEHHQPDAPGLIRESRDHVSGQGDAPLLMRFHHTAAFLGYRPWNKVTREGSLMRALNFLTRGVSAATYQQFVLATD